MLCQQSVLEVDPKYGGWAAISILCGVELCPGVKSRKTTFRCTSVIILVLARQPEREFYLPAFQLHGVVIAQTMSSGAEGPDILGSPLSVFMLSY